MPHLHQNEMMPYFGNNEATLPEARTLTPDEQVQIDLEAPLAYSQEIHGELGIPGNIVAIVNASGKSFTIVDTRDTKVNRDFIIIDDTVSLKDGVGFKGVLEDEPVIIGREHYTDRFKYPSTLSREHFEVTYIHDELFVRNLRPTNETIVTANLAENKKPRLIAAQHIILAFRTQRVEERMLHNPNFGEKDNTAPYGYHLNHPILGRDSSSVDNGVYMGGSAREAILVDGKSLAMKEAYKAVELGLRQSIDMNETLGLRSILLHVMNFVKEVLPYDKHRTETIGQDHHGDKLIGLSTYLKEQTGVCRQQALLAAFILENLINDGYMLGSIGVERNTVEDMGGTHAWAVYKSKNNGIDEVIVVDPAQSFVGTKQKAEREGRWEYRLSSDEH